MVLVQLLLPAAGPAGEDLDVLFASTRAELIERFGGITAYQQSPAKGAWTTPEGRVERDHVIMVEIVTPVLDRAWWQRYQQALAERFNQREIHIRAMAIEVIGADRAAPER